jgi:hypothetical protein
MDGLENLVETFGHLGIVIRERRAVVRPGVAVCQWRLFVGLGIERDAAPPLVAGRRVGQLLVFRVERDIGVYGPYGFLVVMIKIIFFDQNILLCLAGFPFLAHFFFIFFKKKKIIFK